MRAGKVPHVLKPHLESLLALDLSLKLDTDASP